MVKGVVKEYSVACSPPIQSLQISVYLATKLCDVWLCIQLVLWWHSSSNRFLFVCLFYCACNCVSVSQIRCLTARVHCEDPLPDLTCLLLA